MSEGIIKAEPACSSRQNNSHGLFGSSGWSVARESSASGSGQDRSQSAERWWWWRSGRRVFREGRRRST
jgi:hypothetical protein